MLPIWWLTDTGDCACPRWSRTRSSTGACDRPGKHPITARGVHDASTDGALVAAWFAAWPHANLAVRTDVLFVMDCDPRSHGDATFARLERELGELPATPTDETGGGGWHQYFRGVRMPVRGSLGPGLDVKHGPGGYVVVPPSRHASGRAYAWRPGRSPDDVPLAELPPRWLTVAARTSAKAAAPVPARVGHGPDADRVERARRYVARMPVAVAGQGGHAALWAVALAVVRGFALDGEAALAVLREYSARCVPPWSERDLAHKLADAQRAGAPLGYLLARREVRRVA